MIVVQVVAALIGVYIIARTVLSAVRTFVVPRGDNDPLSRFAFRVMFAAFRLAAPPSRPYAIRDRVMAYYGPIALVLLPAWWLVLLALGFARDLLGRSASPLGDAIDHQRLVAAHARLPPAADRSSARSSRSSRRRSDSPSSPS